MENKTAKAIAYAIAQLLETHGLTVRVRRRRGAEGFRSRSKADAEVQYFSSRWRHSDRQFEISIVEYEPAQSQ